MSEAQKIDPNRSVPAWVLVLVGVGGLGGLGLGGAQLARSPSDLGDKLDNISERMAKVEGKVDVLTVELKSDSRGQERERGRLEREIEDVKARVKSLEDRKNGR